MNEFSNIKEQLSILKSQIEMLNGNKKDYFLVGNNWENIAPSVHSIECALDGNSCTVINVTFYEGGYLKPHSHDREETIFVVDGEIEDLIANKTIKTGETYVIPANVEHEIKSDYAKLTVVFRPPFPRK